MIIRTVEPSEIVEIYPFAEGELTKDNFLTGRIEVFPESLRDRRHTENKRVRWQGCWWTKPEWDDYVAKLDAAMEKAFEVEAKTAR